MADLDILRGKRIVWRHLLTESLKHLGYDDSHETKMAALIAEREEAIATLRELCNDFGDNDWTESLALADIIDKHLGNHLHKRSDD